MALEEPKTFINPDAVLFLASFSEMGWKKLHSPTGYLTRVDFLCPKPYKDIPIFFIVSSAA